jgi:DDE superfamily endonuclease
LLIVCLLTGLIQAIRFDKGQMHDFELYKNSKFNLSDELEVSTDSGFQGIQKLHSKVQIPQKSSKLKPLTELQKKQNTIKASKRVPIEHLNRKCKIFKICGCRFRGKHKNYEDTWKLISAIVNLKTSTKHLKFSS